MSYNDKFYSIILLIAVFGGWAAVGLDVTLTGFLAPQLYSTFRVSSLSEPSLLFGIGDGIGAFIFGLINDRLWGRKLTFMMTILGTMIMTGLSATSINWAMYSSIRFLAGIFTGGEMTAGWVILAESIPNNIRSTFLSISQGGISLGYALAAVFSGTFASATALGWRWAYIGSALFALIIFGIRVGIRESPYWQKVASTIKNEFQKELAEKASNRQAISEMFKRQYLFPTVLILVTFAFMMFATSPKDFYYPSWYYQGGITGVSISASAITFAFIGFAIGQFVANLVEGFIMDKIGARKAVLIPLGLIPAVLLMWFIPINISVYLDFTILFIVAFFFQTAWGFMPAYLPAVYPTRIRHTAVGLVWAITYGVFYSLSAYIFGGLVSVHNWAPIFISQMIGYAVFAIGLALLGLEIKGKSLDFLESQKEVQKSRTE
ncbi:MFS transporter [Acidianus brierleyi]|uniref:Major facilitator superfamily (MFS) profile domain-containing protein n=1 Tax=Acidianus brierleyi TaxID=41673 RepID=A0A2U9II68_9CREN|nr:MFS transporter [Acidianus brierleyi]AWR95727.1 MFS transporter [Acidianus brierleyi]